MVMEPKVLLLDEATSQLDPISHDNFLRLLQKINEELGTTIILVEHHLEDVLGMADKIIVMEQKSIFSEDTSLNTCQLVKANRDNFSLLPNFPISVQIYAAFDSDEQCPLNVKQGKEFVVRNFTNSIKSLAVKDQALAIEKAISLNNVAFRYNKNDLDVIDDLSLDIYKGEVLAIVGGNGSGKTTLLNLMAGNLKPDRKSVV